MKRLKNHVVATLRIWRSVPRAVESDEDAAAIVRRKLFVVVTHHGVRRPMGGILCDRTDLVRTYADGFAVAAVFRSQNQLLQEWIVVALGPAVVSLGLQKQQFFRRQCCFLFGFIYVRPIRVQLIATVLSDKDSPA